MNVNNVSKSRACQNKEQQNVEINILVPLKMYRPVSFRFVFILTIYSFKWRGNSTESR